MGLLETLFGDVLIHEGKSVLDGAPIGSGRYRYGSGENPYQHAKDFLTRVDGDLAKNPVYVDKNGKTYTGTTAVAKMMGLSSSQFRVQYSVARNEVRTENVRKAKELMEKYNNNKSAVAKEMGVNESTVRSWLNEKSEKNMLEMQTTADFLKEMVDSNGMVDVGPGVAKELGISDTRLKDALYILEMQGYPTYGGGLPNITNPGKQINHTVLCPPGTAHKEIFDALQNGNVSSVTDYDKILQDGGANVRKAFEYPESLNSKRLQINYAEDGGIKADGLIELRRGVEDISLGNSHYAQVRILVDGTHYLKGMAVYADDLPDGVDVRFNTNKKRGTPALGSKDYTVLKPIKKDDPENPFGSLIKEHGGQRYYDDPNGRFTDNLTGHKQSLSLINKKSDEGDWADWSNKVPSQFLAKQPLKLINQQLKLTEDGKKLEFEDIKSLTNPTIKKKMLLTFAEDCDSAAEHLKAKSFPNQKYEVMLPLKTIADTECYAPNYPNGTKIAAVRFPFAGNFEMAVLTVNNKNDEGKRMITPGAKDAIGINSNVAERMSGADFDGDTAMCFPITDKVAVKAQASLRALEGFDPKTQYGPNSTSLPYKHLSKKNTQREMGEISNLIMDMTIKGADFETEIAPAVKHSMVIIDADKHNLDYKRSEQENNIKALKKKWQGRVENGKYTESASTLITRAKADQSVIKRQGSPKIDDEGNLVWKEVENPTYVKKYTTAKTQQEREKVVTRTQKSTQMAEVKDASELLSGPNHVGTATERAYADYANSMKQLARDARKEYLATTDIKYNASARAMYQKEVDHLEAQYNIATLNKPRERAAQRIATSRTNAIVADHPELEKSDIKKIKQRNLKAAREQVGAKRNPIEITDKDWEAIQAGAVPPSKLAEIINYVDDDKLKQRAMPRTSTNELSPAKVAFIKANSGTNGYTNAELAQQLGVSVATIQKYASQ